MDFALAGRQVLLVVAQACRVTASGMIIVSGVTSGNMQRSYYKNNKYRNFVF
jgi:hypothetical protein